MMLPVSSAFGTGGFAGTRHGTSRSELPGGDALRISHGIGQEHESEPKAEGFPAPALPKARLVFFHEESSALDSHCRYRALA